MATPRASFLRILGDFVTLVLAGLPAEGTAGRPDPRAEIEFKTMQIRRFSGTRSRTNESVDPSEQYLELDRRRVIPGLLFLSCLILASTVVALLWPIPLVAALFHGGVFTILVMLGLAAFATRGRFSTASFLAFLSLGVYLTLTAVPLFSDLVIPVLPTELLLEHLSEDVEPTLGPGAPPPKSDVEVVHHWSTVELGKQGLYRYFGFGPAGLEVLNPRQVAFHHIGHDVVALLAGLIGGLFGFLFAERDLAARSRVPSSQSREVVQRLMMHGR